jgi:hypothetical protein
MIAVEGSRRDVVESVVIDPANRSVRSGSDQIQDWKAVLILASFSFAASVSTVFSTRRSVSPSRTVSKICGTDEFRASERSWPA